MTLNFNCVTLCTKKNYIAYDFQNSVSAKMGFFCHFTRSTIFSISKVLNMYWYINLGWLLLILLSISVKNYKNPILLLRKPFYFPANFTNCHTQQKDIDSVTFTLALVCLLILTYLINLRLVFKQTDVHS